jgi:hypothetical protein
MQEIKHLVVFIFAKMFIKNVFTKRADDNGVSSSIFFDIALHEMFSVWKKNIHYQFKLGQ